MKVQEMYIYIPQVYEWDSEEANVMTLLAKRVKQNCTVTELCEQYTYEYGKYIEEEKLLTIIQRPIFIGYSSHLRSTNERLYQQEGSFVVCTNKVDGHIITNEIISIDSILPIMVIRIPYEYKAIVKKELDLKHSINHVLVYPELPSVANYLREKYKETNTCLDCNYSILKKQEVNIGGIKRLSMVIVLNHLLTIDSIKKIGIAILNEYKDKYAVIWLYIAKENTDFIMKNWIQMLQWIEPTLPNEYKPIPFKNLIQEGVYGEESEEYSVHADYLLKRFFRDDKELLIKNKKNLDRIYSIIQQLIRVNDTNDLSKIKDILQENENLIEKSYYIRGDIGRSRNVEFDKYLEHYCLLVDDMDNMRIWCRSKNLNAWQLRHELTKCIKRINAELHSIEEKYSFWKDKIGVSDEEYNKECE